MLELSRKESLSDEEISQLIEFAKECGGIEYSYQVMEELKEKAFGLLDKLPQGVSTDALRAIFTYVISRSK